MVRARFVALLLVATAPLPAVLPPAQARPAAPAPTVATVERSGTRVSFAWTSLEGPVHIHRLDRPDARPTAATRVATAPASGFTLEAAPWPRPYWLLEDRRGQRRLVAERALPLAGGSNFRDLGGYETADGRRVVWGQLFRSGVMAGLTPDDFRHLGSLGIRTVCDLRSADERAREPVNWPDGIQPTVLATDDGLDMGALAGLFRGGPVTAEATRAAMADFYRTLPYDFAPQFAAMFRELVAGRAPLAVNCSAGKDRTGVAAALILSVLGVPRDTVIADYLLSSRYFRAEMPIGVGEDPTARLLASLPPDALQALMGVERGYIEASFSAIEAKGGLDRYIRETLGLSARDLQTLRRRYLVR